MSKRILILCEAIAPPAYSPRILTLASYLTQRRWHCEIATEQCLEQPFHTDICPIHQMPAYTQILKDKVFNSKEKAFCRFIQQHIDLRSFDIIFCSSYYYFPLQTARKIARDYHKPLVIDLRDIAEQWGETPYFTRKVVSNTWLNNLLGNIYAAIQIRRRNRVLRAADSVTTISPWHAQFLSRFNPHTYLIYNGYDADEFVPNCMPADDFLITYLGKLYSTTLRDPRLLFEALQQLSDEGLITTDKVRVVFHTAPQAICELKDLGEKYGISDMLDIQGYIPRTDILPIMHLSSILLVLTTKATPKGTHGIIGTKFFENIGVEKPILCTRSDEECLADLIHQTNAGLAATNVEETKAFILEKYREWKTNGFTHQAVINKEQFSRQHQAEQFEQLFLKLINKQ